MPGPLTAVVDYGAGNLKSVAKALARSGLEVEVTGDPVSVGRAEGVVLPGVGAFADAVASLRSKGLDRAIRDAIAAGRPYLGICLGLQVLFEESDEHGVNPGLALLPGRVERFAMDEGPDPLRVPHIGWNEVRFDGSHPMLERLPARETYYFVHSYRAIPRDAGLRGGADGVRRALRGRGGTRERLRRAVPPREEPARRQAPARRVRGLGERMPLKRGRARVRALAGACALTCAVAACSKSPVIQERRITAPNGATQKIAVVPFYPRPTLERHLVEGGPSAEEAAALVTRFVTEGLSASGFQVVPAGDVKQAFDAEGLQVPRLTPGRRGGTHRGGVRRHRGFARRGAALPGAHR